MTFVIFFVSTTDNILLLQPFCTKAQFLNGKAKVDVIEKVAGMFVVIIPNIVVSFSLSSPIALYV